MATLVALPHELSLHIFSLLECNNKVHLSATCRSFRTQLIPEIFSTIRFTSDEASAASALAAVETYGQYTKKIEFTCQCNHEESPPPPGPSLPPAACKLLKGLLTPNLHTVKLGFQFGLDDEDLDPFDIYDDLEDAGRVRLSERQDRWRAQMNGAWEALVGNALVRELILDELPAKWTSTYDTDAFRRFLNQLESATIHIFGIPYEEWRSNITSGYEDFVNKLGAAFFSHMDGLKHLHLWATDPLGLAGERMPYTKLPLRPEDLPALQSLTLENSFVSPELIPFIKFHAQVLKSLRLNESFCGDYLSWTDFFDQVYEGKPSLTEVIYRGDKAPFMIDEEDEVWWADESDLLHFRQRLEADPTLNVFRRGHLDPDTGVLFFNLREELKRFNQGDDQRAYVRLMGLVNGNRAEAKVNFR
ncbi:hypothetical protein TRIATDRAFT_283217 [Trichoderma atroviride IMI 206040]|uniref:F-box domain-containing protein n=1 Tax=Hypocrea atroviridis (strain ATCC 20476 / IMI 206040) TaxID=452589 RepID=G9NU13_HYPAI|nr:uncharacterized protein TRIATDRAFT_283217 [Trichoderma atroviride IMI 206040]EHK45550.1 hypothetical protein TRIATDRAFT_283217 [Trichoderma atroviride IMI 206040]